MNPPLRTRHPARWPFWLLLAAWVCANAPAIAVCAALTWLGEARHFSHQQRLVTDVAFVLTGHQAPGLGVMAAVKDVTLPKPLPATPAGVELKKIDLTIERIVEMRRPATNENDFVVQPQAWPKARREAPPREPPRVTAIG
jgi:hypothetical protein